MKVLATLLVSVALCCSTPLIIDFNYRVPFPQKIYEDVMTKYPTDNLAISPYSITTCLALVSLGAAGKTTQEVLHLLQITGASQEEIAYYYGRIFYYMKSKATENITFTILNHIFVDQKYGLKADFNQLADGYFHAGVSNVNFSQSDAAAEKINTWVTNETDNSIKEIVKSSDFNKTTDVVALNAIYFKAPLKHKFLLVGKEDFYLNKNDKVQVDMMVRIGMYGVVDLPNIDAKSVSIPYAGTDIYFTIILPNAVDGLANTFEKIKTVGLQPPADTQFSYTYKEFELILPKFKIEFDISLVQILKQMGLKNIFSNEADLSNLVNTDLPVKVSDVKYKAVLEVGTEVVDEMVFRWSIDPKIQQFKVDHPFLFMIRDNSFTYFVGQVVNL